MNIAEEIFLRVAPESIAVIEREGFTTYAELDALSSKIATSLRHDFDKVRTPRIGVQGHDGLGYIALALGILRAEACFVPISAELSKAEAEHLISTLALDGIITPSESSKQKINFSLEKQERMTQFAHEEDLAALHPAFIRFSSGTTGASKGIVLSHKTLIERIEAANSGLKITGQDRILWVLSMSHHFAVSIMLYLWKGAAVVIPESHLPGDILAAANQHHTTVFYAAPCHYLLLTSGNEHSAWPSLRLAISTTAPLRSETAEKFAEAYGIYPRQALGIMEAGLPFLQPSDQKVRSGTVGVPQSGYQAEIRDAVGAVVDTGVSGDLYLKGPGMFDAYIEPWQTREEATQPDGWFNTGDIARQDAGGFLYLMGRSRSVINIGGMKLFPEEVETLLCTHPEVMEARVLGIEHSIFGSVPIAEVLPKPNSIVTPTELLSLCRKALARYKVPVEIRFVENIPKTASGKIKRP